MFMRSRGTVRSTWRACLLSAAVCGCQHDAVYRDDPLVASKRPVLGKVTQTAAPLLIAQAEPATPLLPPVALARLAPLPQYPAPAGYALNSTSPAAAPPLALPRAPLEALPVTREKESGPVRALPAVRRRALATYGHAPDYSWLQGILSRDDHGRWSLRYTEPGPGDFGPVPLEPDDEHAFDPLRPGDVVVVQGEIGGGTPLRYHVRAVRLAERPAP
jgi:hypothetical protein